MKKLVRLEEAQKLMDELRERYYFKRGAEIVSVDAALNRELAEPIISKERSPPYHIASYDGYAMRSEDCGSYPLKIVHSIYAGDEKDEIPDLKGGEAMAIATGAYLPEGADCVLKLEDAEVKGDLLYGVPIKKWTKVVKAGSGYDKGEVILEERQRLRPQEIGVLHSLGIEEVKVFERPKVAVFSTGDEVCNGMLRDTNAPVVIAMLKEWGCETEFLGAVPDNYEEIKKIFIKGSEYDAVITSGGVSVGDRDYVTRVIKELGTLLLHKVRTRPGKPIVVGIINDKPVFGLPGKPTGAFIATELNLRRYFIGKTSRPVKRSKMSEDIKMATKGFANIVFVRMLDGHAIPMGFKDSPMKLIPSGDFYNVSTIASSLRATITDGYVIINKDVKKGEIVEVNMF